jgi:hypothetical protein
VCEFEAGLSRAIDEPIGGGCRRRLVMIDAATKNG